MEHNAQRLPTRSDIAAADKWRLEDIYPNETLWEQDFEKIKVLAAEVREFSGKLSASPDTLHQCLSHTDTLLSLTDKLFVYARMRRDEDNAVSLYQGLVDRATALITDVYATVSFITPEITAMDESILRGWLDSHPQLSLYRQVILEALRQKAHILSQREEELLALASDVTGSTGDVFTMFNNADIRFPNIHDENGNEVELTKGRYVKFLENKNRDVRKEAFDTMYETYGKSRNTLAAMLVGNIKRNQFYRTARKYGSSLEAALDSDNIDTRVYTSLIDTIHAHLPLLHRYLRLRRKMLGVPELHMYDLYVPLVEEPESQIAWKDACRSVTEGLAPMGAQYQSYLEKGFSEGWIDVYENEGKTSGAYSWGCYLSHPFVLMNYQGRLNDVFTLAHEMGHALHSYYTNQTQPYVYSEYKIFVAEVASTVNENLLMQHMLKNAGTKAEKAYLLNHLLEEFRGTVFRQVMFAEFELRVHEMLESGEALTTDALCALYKSLNDLWFGPECVVDDAIAMEWARIPHFYSSFYVYKYATGFSAATALSHAILTEGETAVARYTEFLRSGGSDYPLELLKRAGVDLTTPAPVEAALKVFEETLNQLEALLEA